MVLKVSVSPATKLSDGLWKGKFPLEDLELFAGNVALYAPYTVCIVSRGLKFDSKTSTLSMEPQSMRVVAIGKSDDALFMDENGSHAGDKRSTVSGVEGEIRRPFLPIREKLANADELFLAEAEKLGEDLLKVGTLLLERIRDINPNGRLTYHPASKKFVDTPNFWTVKVQPRDRSYRITVRGIPEAHSRWANKIEINPDMGSYSSFKLFDMSQLEDAIHAVEHASHI